MLRATGLFSKLSASGSQLLYSNSLPVMISAVTADAAGNAYVTGYGNSPAFPVTPGAFQSAPNPNNVSAGVAAKLDASGAVIYATYISGSGRDAPSSIALDAAGDAFIAGSTTSTDFPVTPGAFLTAIPGRDAVFLTKLNPQGSSLVFSTYLGSQSEGEATVKLDGQGTAYVSGLANSTSFPTTAGSSSFTASGCTQTYGFLVRFSADGSSLVYSTFLAASSFDTAQVPMDVDSAGNAVVVGVSSSTELPVGAAAFQPEYGGGTTDGYIARFTPTGQLSGATYLGGSLADSPFLIALSPNGSVVVGGITESPDFPGLTGAFYGASETFVTSIFPSLTILNAASYVATGIAPGEIVALMGYGMGPAAGVVAAGSPLPEQLGGVSVSFGGVQAPLFYVQSGQINAQVPWELEGQATTIQVSFSETATPVLVAPSLPGVFLVGNSDGTENSPSNPAAPGSLISIYGTGGGSASPAGVAGQNWPLSPLSFLTLPVSVAIGEENAMVLYPGSAPTLESGVFQINVMMPPGLAAGETTLVVTIGAASSVATPIAIGAP
jgi:uncharacterized protein (TIGR03437 family)